jgi:hypothetical protein
MKRNLKRVYLLFRSSEAEPVNWSGQWESQEIDPIDYWVAAAVPISEIDRLVDVYEMFRKPQGGLRAVCPGDVICREAHVGMLLVPHRSLLRGETCMLVRTWFELERAYNPRRIYA